MNKPLLLVTLMAMLATSAYGFQIDIAGIGKLPGISISDAKESEYTYNDLAKKMAENSSVDPSKIIIVRAEGEFRGLPFVQTNSISEGGKFQAIIMSNLDETEVPSNVVLVPQESYNVGDLVVTEFPGKKVFARVTSTPPIEIAGTKNIVTANNYVFLWGWDKDKKVWGWDKDKKGGYIFGTTLDKAKVLGRVVEK